LIYLVFAESNVTGELNRHSVAVEDYTIVVTGLNPPKGCSSAAAQDEAPITTDMLKNHFEGIARNFTANYKVAQPFGFPEVWLY
jgi:hypothetical protein